MRLLVVPILMCFSSPSVGGWDVMVFPEDSKSNPPGASIIVYADGPQSNHADFGTAISEIENAGRASELKHVTLHAIAEKGVNSSYSPARAVVGYGIEMTTGSILTHSPTG